MTMHQYVETKEDTVEIISKTMDRTKADFPSLAVLG